ncbi:MAG: hypothetical protein U0936_15955 [Planctomycetaceae bacterium]
MTNPFLDNVARVTRRQMFGTSASGVGLAALASLMQSSSANGAEPPLPGLPHFAPKAKRVVVLWQGGGPSHVDLFDDKPVMANGWQGYSGFDPRDHATLHHVQRIRQVAMFAINQAVSTLWPERNVAEFYVAERGIDC